MYEPIDEQETKPVQHQFSLRTAVGRVFRGMYDVVETLVIAGAIVIFTYFFLASPHEVIGRSMEDNFWNGEYLLADKVSYHLSEPRRGDVVIFKQTETEDYIKRIIGAPGDTVSVRDGHFYVNGELLNEEAYLDPDVYTDPGVFLTEGTDFTVPKGKYFVAGDNRQHSSDSRTFGPIAKDTIKGRALVIYWPFSHLHIVDRPSYDQS